MDMVMSREEQYWCRDSNIVLKQENNIVIGKYTLNKYYRAEFGFMPFHSLAKESLWKYRDAYAENWMAPSFDDSQWTPSKKSVFPAPGRADGHSLLPPHHGRWRPHWLCRL